MHDVAEFLKAHEPFSGLDETDLDRLSRSLGGGPRLAAMPGRETRR
jgi:hypothetical protein